MSKSKLTNEQRVAAKVAAEEKAALEFSHGWEAGIAREPRATDSLVYEAGYIAGSRERARRAKEEAESDDLRV